MDFSAYTLFLGAIKLEALIAKWTTWKHMSPYLGALAIFLGGWLLAKSLSLAIGRMGRFSGNQHSVLVSRKISFYVILILASITALNQAGVDLSGMLAAAGILTVAISFAAQTSVSNVISGIFLLFDRPFSIGDTIRVQETLGSVRSIGLLSSKVRTFDNIIVRIPNEALLKSTIMNYSLLEVRRVDISTPIAYEESVERVTTLFLQIMQDHPNVLDEPAPVILTDLMNDSGITLITRVWVKSSEFILTRSDLHTSIAAAIRKHEIALPRQHRVVQNV